MCVVLGIVPLAALQGRASTKPSIKESSWEQNRNISDYGKYFFSFFHEGENAAHLPCTKLHDFMSKCTTFTRFSLHILCQKHHLIHTLSLVSVKQLSCGANQTHLAGKGRFLTKIMKA